VYTTERRTFASSSELVVEDPIGPRGVFFWNELRELVVFLAAGIFHY